ncbi:hypothetical protein [Edwardsiella ictaluri]|nr:hypothetical protein [Edwardsiella ictaluri]
MSNPSNPSNPLSSSGVALTHQHVVPPLQQDEIDLLSLLLVLFKAKSR